MFRNASNGKRITARHGKQGGAALVEFALTLPILLGLCMAATDFGRIFYHAVSISNAAGVGAFFGARDIVHSGDFNGQEAHAEDDTKNLPLPGHPVTAEADQYCVCPDQTTKDCADTTQTCGAYGLPRGYVKVTVRQQFPLLAPWPMIGGPSEVSKTAFFRAQ